MQRTAIVQMRAVIDIRASSLEAELRFACWRILAATLGKAADRSATIVVRPWRRFDIISPVITVALTPGTRLGVYEVLSALDAGGMGEVYRATDTRLKRDVAIKVLLPEVAQNPERLARFEREAQILASLNHPNIASIYGVEQAGDTTALVLEFIDGPTLAERIASTNGRGLPLDEALPLARQIAEALEAAHEQGIIHRDLKPANIKVRPDGTVKVLDFGLAKALDPAVGVHAGARQLSNSPTFTSPALMTGVGVLLGTAAYMSPAQAKGRPADKRSDIWAFGCVLYEMLAGRRAFGGDSVVETLSAVISQDPAWAALPADTPEHIFQLLRACLTQDTTIRLRSASAIPFLMTMGAKATTVTKPPRRGRVALAAVGVAALISGGAIGAVWNRDRTASQVPRVSLSLLGMPGVPLPLAGGGGVFREVALSRDGTMVVYRSVGGVFVARALDGSFERKIAEAENAQEPFISWDGKWLGFTNGQNDLQKVPIRGGPVTTLCHLDSSPRGAAWLPDDTIYFATADQKTGLWRVPANGGQPISVTEPDQVHEDHIRPAALPDGRLLFTVLRPRAEDSSVALLDPVTGTTSVLIQRGTSAVYGDGVLAYASGGRVRAVGFDAAKARLVGESRVLAEDVEMRVYGGANFDLSGTGTLLFQRRAPDRKRQLAWVDRNGEVRPLNLSQQGYRTLRLSPNGSRVVLDIRNQSQDGRLWVFDLARETLERITNDLDVSQRPLWTPDGRYIVFSGTYDGQFNLFRQRADGSGAAEVLAPSAARQLPTAIAPDGDTLLYSEYSSDAVNDDIRVMSLASHRSMNVIASPFTETHAELSPDGRFLAYESTESGGAEVYVRPYPEVGEARWQVSTGGGRVPVWGPDGHEIFYADLQMRIRVVPVDPRERSLKLGSPQVIPNATVGDANARTFDVTGDGRRLLVLKDVPIQETIPPSLTVIVAATRSAEGR